MCGVYQCSECRKAFPMAEMHRDHIMPVIDPAVGFVTWDQTIDRMYTETGWQALCKPCHKTKTAEERKVANERRAIEREEAKGTSSV